MSLVTAFAIWVLLAFGFCILLSEIADMRRKRHAARECAQRGHRWLRASDYFGEFMEAEGIPDYLVCAHCERQWRK